MSCFIKPVYFVFHIFLHHGSPFSSKSEEAHFCGRYFFLIYLFIHSLNKYLLSIYSVPVLQVQSPYPQWLYSTGKERDKKTGHYNNLLWRDKESSGNARSTQEEQPVFSLRFRKCFLRKCHQICLPHPTFLPYLYSAQSSKHPAFSVNPAIGDWIFRVHLPLGGLSQALSIVFENGPWEWVSQWVLKGELVDYGGPNQNYGTQNHDAKVI